ncbi:ABC transporter substrate-binding protein [Spirosoma flavum]|uniref:Thiamine pyrimidine synthase n=1 Tax=Spirosoma flavum TaxID=2048557 RepID=A0ABW6AIP1_9BACT
MLVRLALDWTPNTNHTGFYVAIAQGLYQKAGLEVQMITPDQDNYQTTPAKRVAQGLADLAIDPSESVISYQINGLPLVAVATLLARDASTIATLQRSGIERPSQLEGKIYGSYNARYEDEIIRQMMRNDGAQGQFSTRKPDRLSLWQALLDQQVDATWIFHPWEGVEALTTGIALNEFGLADYGIPYGYSPILTATSDWATQHATPLRQFLEATSQGFRFAVEQPDQAASLLWQTANQASLRDLNFLQQSQRVVSSYYLNELGQWGWMDGAIWQQFINWLLERKLLKDKTGAPIEQMDAGKLFTNEYLPARGVPTQD